MNRLIVVLASALTTAGCASEPAPTFDGCSDGTCEEETELVYGVTPNQFYSRLSYQVTDSPLGHRQLSEDEVVVLDQSDSIHTTFRLFIVDGPRYVLLYEERQGDSDLSVTLESARFEGDLSLEGTTLLFDDGEFASAEPSSELGISLVFPNDLGRPGLAGRTVSMLLFRLSSGLEECSGEATDECPVTLPSD